MKRKYLLRRVSWFLVPMAPSIYTQIMLMILVFVILVLDSAVNANQSFNYEKLHGYGLGKPIIYKPKKISYPYPEVLPTIKPVYVRSPYKNVYQGRRNKGDRRVYNKHFHYPPKARGHHVYCEGVFDCTLSHMAVETNGSIPIILRGGAGYKFFSVVIRAAPHDQLDGRVRAYCRPGGSDENASKYRWLRRIL